MTKVRTFKRSSSDSVVPQGDPIPVPSHFPDIKEFDNGGPFTAFIRQYSALGTYGANYVMKDYAYTDGSSNRNFYLQNYDLYSITPTSVFVKFKSFDEL